jgi:hypothetical protein
MVLGIEMLIEGVDSASIQLQNTYFKYFKICQGTFKSHKKQNAEECLQVQHLCVPLVSIVVPLDIMFGIPKNRLLYP